MYRYLQNNKLGGNIPTQMANVATMLELYVAIRTLSTTAT